MFAGQPQPVEIHHRGIWYSGELIGWRHESDGRVAARVRCRVDGLRHSTWKDLADLRLPDPQAPAARASRFPAVVRRPVPACLQDDEDDATRPHALLAAMREPPGQARARHRRRPPRRPASPTSTARRRTASRSPSRSPSDAATQRLDRHSAYLSVV